MPKRIIIWGASGHALVVADVVRLQGQYEIAGFLDDEHPERRGAPFCGATVLGGAEQLASLRDTGVRHVIIGFGNCRARLDSSLKARAAGLELATAIHPRAAVAADATVGPGTVVMAGAVVNSAAVIGENVIVNTNATVEHECLIEDGAHVCPGVTLGGRVRIGRAAWIGIGATVRDGVAIGAGAVIGAGSVVLQDLPDNVVAYGVPAAVQGLVE